MGVCLPPIPPPPNANEGKLRAGNTGFVIFCGIVRDSGHDADVPTVAVGTSFPSVQIA